MSYDPDDAPFVPQETAEDDEPFDYHAHQAQFTSKQKAAFEALQQEVANQYEAEVEGRKYERPEPEQLVIGDRVIPNVTPQESEYLVEHVEAGPTDSGLTNMPFRGSKQYKTVKRPNPNYVSPEMRASMIQEAQAALDKVQKENEAQVVRVNGHTHLVQTSQTSQTSFFDRVAQIKEALPHETIVGFEMKDGRLVITLE